MKLNYLSRCIFSRICLFLLRNTFWLPSHSSTGTFRWLHPGLRSRKGGHVLTGTWGAEPTPRGVTHRRLVGMGSKSLPAPRRHAWFRQKVKPQVHLAQV